MTIPSYDEKQTFQFKISSEHIRIMFRALLTYVLEEYAKITLGELSSLPIATFFNFRTKEKIKIFICHPIYGLESSKYTLSSYSIIK
jgi:hypothetical protein